VRIPKRPPDPAAIATSLEDDRLRKIIGVPIDTSPDGKYLHWDKLAYYPPPGNLSHKEWWFAIKLRRRQEYKTIPLTGKDGQSFQYLITDPIPERLHQIDTGAGGMIRMPEQITNPETKDQYYVRSLIDEAITSSQLEGAATTREVARDMIRAGRPPRDDSERMILNNYLTMKRIGKLKDRPLSKQLVFDIHRQVTDQTLKDPSAGGRFRRSDERIDIGDDYGQVFHLPPNADELEQRMTAMCDFANGKIPGQFVHPVIRSIILHFWLAYDHPFVDGNGRTARALFYWSMLRHGFWLCEYISISQFILKAPVKYGRAFLYTETDENDLTYFILYHLDIIHRAVNELHRYINRRTQRLRELEVELRGLGVLNHRQKTLVSHALRHPLFRYRIESHKVSHNVVYQTARTDLLDLRDRGLLKAKKIGKAWHFTPVRGLEERLRVLA